MTDERLVECSALATGVYIRVMCIMHKSDDYGMVLLRQKEKQNSSKFENFASKLAKLLPFRVSEIRDALEELVDEDVLQMTAEKLSQKRMIKDAEISEKRSLSGSKGGKANIEANYKAKPQAKPQANCENESENESDNNNIPEKSIFIAYGLENASKNRIKVSETALAMKYDAWAENGWKNGHDKPIKVWKTALLNTLRYIKEPDATSKIAPGTEQEPIQRSWNE